MFFLLVGCASISVQEFEVYKTAFDKTNEASTAILDQLALQERALFLRHYKYARSTIHFEPGLARFLTDSVDPPGTAAFRGALQVIKAYNDLLYGLESGQTAQTLAAKLSAMESATSSSIVAVGGVAATATGANAASLATSMAALDKIFQTLLPFIQLGLKYRAQEEFRTFLVQNYGLVRDLLWQLRKGTSVIFPVLTAASVREFNEGGAMSAEDSKRIETYRKLLADWVVLLEVTIKALDRAKAAAEAPPTLVDNVTGLTVFAVEMETAAKSAKTNLAKLATK
ncbi:hypothetical protein AAE026_29335 [Bradyrhizobium sp. DN5]|uniref:hypothetical protein n=1 Tax=Bradyrhizobium sp. DN5 TaxID=3056950 RepID=UPI0035241167